MSADATTLPLIDGRFRLLRLLAVGGMGELYLAAAKDTEIEGLEQLVVMKRILPEFASDPDVVTMFLIEARIAARLDHPNVVRVYDIGRADGSIYFTMEYLHGADLGRLFDAAQRSREGFPLGHALTIVLGICSGLHFAHEMRRVDGRPMAIVHRDVSPSNVFVTHNGEIKLVDFGIAKVISSTQLTMDGMRKGKLAYMSPEQVRGAPVDRRSDIFAIGILLYEMVTLTHLFDADSEFAILEQIAGGEVPPPSQRRPGVAPELERIILKALALAREDRYATAEELAEDLERFAYEHQVQLSRLALRQFLKRMIGEAEYPWYTDDTGPEEAEAVRSWFQGAQPEDTATDVEIVDINLSDLFELEEVFEPDTPALAEEAQPPPPQPPPPRARPRIPRAMLLGAGAAVACIAAAVAFRSCRRAEPPPPEPPPARTAPEPPQTRDAPPPPPPVESNERDAGDFIVPIEVPPATPAKKPAKKKKRPAKQSKQRAP